jgi:predicted nucleic acid-binding protein
MLYFDSSLLVSLLSSEPRTAELQKWFSTRDPERLCLSEWSITEFQSAMSFKRRTGQLSAHQRVLSELVFKHYVESYFRIVHVRSQNFHRAAEIAGREDINLRAPDALHLAIAECLPSTVCTLDSNMHRAALVLEIDSVIP